MDKQTLIRLVDRPVAGAGDSESAEQRRARIKKQVEAEKAKGNKAFLKTVARAEGFSVSRLKQLLQAEPAPTKPKFRRSEYSPHISILSLNYETLDRRHRQYS